MTVRSGEGTADVPALLDAQKIGPFQILIAGLCAAVVFMDGFDAQAIGYVAPSLSRAWKLQPGALGPVFSIGLFGLMIGALVFGPAADRFGRKPVVIFCTAFFGLCTLLTVSAGSLRGLMLWRFLTGLGLGGAMPNSIALTGEYSPHRSRATMIMVMFIGFSLGAALGGALAAQLVPTRGWTSVFWVGGVFPLLLVPILMAWLPESARFLALKGTADARIHHILTRIDPQLRFEAGTRFEVPEQHAAGFTVRHLFSEQRAVTTLLLWVMFFMNLLVLYFMASWLPTVIHNAGVSERLAIIISTLFQVGGAIGTVVLARCIDRLSPTHVLAAAYFLAGVFVAAVGQASTSVAAIGPLIFAAGFCIVGAQIGANAFAAMYYPTFIRSTGVGWALGIGRLGSIIGPLVGGLMLALRWDVPFLFLVGAVPVLIASGAIFAVGRIERARRRARP
jgi:MFS transporter, AAHS family, 4-hydroxybenzoate transporter